MKQSILAVCLSCFVPGQFGLAQDYPMKPNEEHKVLKGDVGTWDAEITMWMEGPDGDTMTSTGVETVRMLGEFWIVSDFEYEFMGEKTYGHGLIGYDPSLKKYVGMWHESASPYRASMEGTYDAEAKRMTYFMTGKDPQGNDQDYKIFMTYPEAAKRNFEMHTKMPGSDDFVKIMEIAYTKR